MSRSAVAKSAAISPVGRALRRPWYRFWGTVERRLFQGRPYTLQVPFGHRVYTPWFDEESGSEFAEALRAVRRSGPLTVSADRCYVLYEFCRRSLRLPGDVAECGVYQGGTAHLLCCVLSQEMHPPRLHLFDTFAGMPATVPSRDYHVAGHFSDTSLERVRERFGIYPFCEFHQGLIPDTFSEAAAAERFSFVHIDVDLFTSTLECCKWFWPRLVPGGVLVIDDYGFYPYRHAARAAVDGFFAGDTDQPIALPTGQAIVLKS